MPVFADCSMMPPTSAGRDEAFLLCGLDEAGRGPLAGPVVASAVILPDDFPQTILNDSKKLSEKKRELAEKIIKTGGCLVSEYLPGVSAEAWRFVHRNRIIAALSPATVVVESPPGSGALITAQYALDYNRDVMIHEAAFSASAQAVSRRVRLELEKKIERGEAVKGKAERTAERYVADGAPVIKDYADYRRARSESPGTRSGEPALF